MAEEVTKPSVEDALSFVEQVKQKFVFQPEKYMEFKRIMTEKARNANVLDCIHCIADLLQGHPDLIVGFNKFLPRGTEINPQTATVHSNLYNSSRRGNVSSESVIRPFSAPAVPVSTSQKSEQSSSTSSLLYLRYDPMAQEALKRSIDGALSLLQEINRKFVGQPEKCMEFKKFLLDRPKKANMLDSIHRMADLLRGHPNLIVCLNTFLPLGTIINPQTGRVHSDLYNNSLRGNVSSESAISPFSAPAVPVSTSQNSEQSSSTASSRSLLNLPHDPRTENIPIPLMEPAVAFLKEAKREFVDDPGRFGELVKSIHGFIGGDLLDSIHRGAEILHGHPALIVAFNKFLPGGIRVDPFSAIVTGFHCPRRESTVTSFSSGSVIGRFRPSAIHVSIPRDSVQLSDAALSRYTKSCNDSEKALKQVSK